MHAQMLVPIFILFSMYTQWIFHAGELINPCINDDWFWICISLSFMWPFSLKEMRGLCHANLAFLVTCHISFWCANEVNKWNHLVFWYLMKSCIVVGSQQYYQKTQLWYRTKSFAKSSTCWYIYIYIIRCQIINLVSTRDL